MRHLFLPGADLRAATLLITGSDYHHLANVLRVGARERLIVLDNRGGALLAEVEAVEKRSLTVRGLGPADAAPEPLLHITIGQAPGRGDKLEQVIQHATEAGASAYLPLLTARTALRLDPRAAEAKRARWEMVARGAAEQAGRARIPSVALPVTLPALLPRFTDYATIFLLHPAGPLLAHWLSGGKGEGAKKESRVESRESRRGERVAQPSALPHDSRLTTLDSILVLVGPEGGFTPEEVETARQAGALVVSLGPYILRTETAALIAVSQLLYEAQRQALGGRTIIPPPRPDVSP